MVTLKEIRKVLHSVVTVVEKTTNEDNYVARGVLINSPKGKREPVVLFEDSKIWYFVEFSELEKVTLESKNNAIKLYVPGKYYSIKKYINQR